MILAVVDTNVLASGFASQVDESIPAQVIVAWRTGRFVLSISEHILAELTRTLNRAYFVERLTPAQADEDIRLLRREATLTPITVEVHGAAPHPEDDLVLATGVSAGAEYLVAGDFATATSRSLSEKCQSTRKYVGKLPS